MATTGDRIAGTGTSVTRSTGTAWTNPGNITANDGTTASITGGSAGSAYLVASNFGFTIPTGSVIQGVTVKFDAAESSTGTESVTAQLQDAGAALIGTTLAQTVSGTTLTVYTYGGTANLWGTGTSLTPAVVNDPDFGVRFWFTTTHNMTVDYVSIAIEYLAPVSGSLSASESGSDTFTSSGDVIVKGSLSASETGSDTFSASGTVGNAPITGTLAATETGSDTFAATGKVTVKGSLAATESGADAFASTGKVIVRGSLSAAESGSDTFASTGKVIVKGALAVSEVGADAFASTGKVVVKGSLSVSETGADEMDSQGSPTGATVGDLHVTEGNDTLSGSGQVKVQGALAANESSDAFSASGSVKVQGSLSVSETGDDLFDSQGDTIGGRVGDLHGYESGPDSLSASGKVAVQGSLSVAEAGQDAFASLGSTKEVTGSLHGTEGQDLFAGTSRPSKQGGGLRPTGFVPFIDASVKLKPTPRLRGSSASLRSTVTSGAVVRARVSGAKGGTAVVIVYECSVPVSPRTKAGTSSAWFLFDYTFTAAAPRAARIGSHYIKPADQVLAPTFYGVRQGTATPNITAVLNPTDDELMAIIRLVKQRRQQQRSSVFRTFR